VDQHALIVDMLSAFLAPRFAVSGMVFTDGADLLATVARTAPDLVILDPALGRLHGIDPVALLHTRCPQTRVVCLGRTRSLALAADSFAAGAVAFVSREAPIKELLTALRGVLNGERHVDPRLGVSDVDELQRHRTFLHRLTARELEVVNRLLEGWQMKQVARDLKITPRTVAFHKYRVMAILGVHNNAELRERMKSYSRVAVPGPC
jgi:DNA-binding NarL/FixJ family response regulator